MTAAQLGEEIEDELSQIELTVRELRCLREDVAGREPTIRGGELGTLSPSVICFIERKAGEAVRWEAKNNEH
jgi:hypothetical protein